MIVAMVIAGISGMLYAEKLPKIDLRMENGAVVTGPSGNDSYIGYKLVDVTHSGILFWKKVTVKCSGKGNERCRAVINGGLYYFTVEDDKGNSYYFDSEVLMNVTNSLLDDMDNVVIKGEGKGEKSKTISMYDKDGVQRLISIRAVYNVDDTYTGSVGVYMDVVK